MHFRSSSFLLIFLLIHCVIISAQDEFVLHGKVTDEEGHGLSLVNVSITESSHGTVTDTSGYYVLRFPHKGPWHITFSSIGYESASFPVFFNREETKTLDVQLVLNVKELHEVQIRSAYDRTSNLTRIDLKTFQLVPNTSGNLESILKTLPGVSSNNELSSQYSVRGGNFDENLVFINDVEVYRPFLIRSGQQEGLSIINPDLVSSIRFSAGGFDASYGDKMSSVLDITYKRPQQFGGSASGSLLGGSMHLEGATKSRRLTYIVGVRYKTTQYLLSSMDTRGEYKPNFIDIQSFITWAVSSHVDFHLLTIYERNQYRFTPVSRETDFGTIGNSYRLKIYYDGGELDNYDTWFGAATWQYHPVEKLNLKLITSAYQANEQETFDIEGQYLINELDSQIGSKTAGDSIANIGVGTYLDHARNRLVMDVISMQHSGSYDGNKNRISWGLKAQNENIHDHLNEWKLVDSAGYSTPYDPNTINLDDVVKTRNSINSIRMTGFIQNTFKTSLFKGNLFITAGVRGMYWNYNGQFLMDPRVSLSFDPQWKRDIQWRLAAGIYDQPPFYKEMRNPQGEINPNIKAQRSFHLVAGGDYYFQAWDRPFKFTSEAYYKYLWDLIPYKVDNVRVVYAGDNIAKGYATGIDFKINGEFVKNAESWASLSIMRTRENILNDFYYNASGERIEPGYYPRPTDQLLNFGLYFQDYVPQNPSYRVNLYFLYGGRLPFSPPVANRYDLVYRMPAYKRVDIGFTKVLKEEGENNDKHPWMSHFRSIMASAEIFNLFGVNNTISYLWVKTVSNLENAQGMYAVPNYLTGRRFNIRLQFNF